MNGLALCAGIEGIGLALKIACPEYRTVCYVEREAYAAAVLVERMEEGWLDQAPVWDDLATFQGRRWRGFVDIVHAGLPCQPYSVAGQQHGDQDERYIWPEFFRIVREVQPPLVFLENVPGLLAWFRPIGEELSSLGYEFEAGLFSASEIGGSHERQRLFVLAISREYGRRGRDNADPRAEGSLQAQGPSGSIRKESVSHSIQDPLRIESERRASATRQAEQGNAIAGNMGEALGNPGTSRLEIPKRQALQEQGWGQEGGAATEPSPFPPGPGDTAAWAAILEEWPEVEPALCGVANGIPNRVDRLRACGNAVVPLTAAWAFSNLMERLRSVKKCQTPV